MPKNKLPELMYQGKSVLEITRLYEAELRKNDDFKSNIHASALNLYSSMISDKKSLALLRKDFNSLYTLMDRDYPHLLFSIAGRCKSFISWEHKVRKLIAENRSLDSLRDTFAYRIVIFGDYTEEELVMQCYTLMNQLIQYYLSTGYILCDEDPVSETLDKNSKEFEKFKDYIVLPEESGIKPEYLYGVKDYILHPKKNGYQSLHCAFRAKAGFYFEVQVRTLNMDGIAAEGDAHHGTYKDAKYADRVVFDPKKINIPGYCVVPPKGEKVMDMVGLEKPLCIFSRQKTNF